MNLPEKTTSSSPLNKAAIANGILAFGIISGVIFLILSSLHEEKKPNGGSLQEPENPLAVEQRFMPGSTPEAPFPLESPTYYVSPSGNDDNDGRSQEKSFQSIQKAIDKAGPGESILLADGIYDQEWTSQKDGTKEKPIRINGSPKAIIKGDDGNRIIEINHDYLTLEGFTVDGLVGDPKKSSGYRDKLIYVQGKTPGNGVTGLRLLHLTIQNAGGECIRLRYFAEKNEVAYSTIQHCGAYDFTLDGDGKNGEGIYIGTAPEQRKDGNNPTADTDVSQSNWIHHNTFNTQGNECIDIKEGSQKNIVEYNRCTGQLDKDSGGIGSRGNENVFRYNTIFGNRGAGIRLGGDSEGQGINNFLYQNTFTDNEEGGIKIMRKPQAKICENSFKDNEEGDLVGEYKEDFENLKKCP